MRRQRRSLARTPVVLAGVWILASAVACGQQMSAQLQQSRVYLGDPVTLMVTVQDCEDCPRPTLPPSYARDFQLVEGAPQQSTQMSIANGRMSRSSTMNYPWQLTAREAGKFQLEEVRCTTPDGTELKASLPALTVIPPEAHDELFVTVEMVPQAAFREQPLTLRVRIGVRSNSKTDPLARLSQPLTVTLPWLNPPEQFETTDLREWLQSIVSDRGPFHIDGTTISTGGGFFQQSAAARFTLPASQEQRAVAANPGKTSDYWVYTLDRTLTPVASGSFEFGRVVVKGFYGNTQHYLVSEPVTVDVGDPPRGNRPASWTGSIGALIAQSTADPTKVRVGDPVEVIVSLGGPVRLASLFLPKLENQTEIGDSFKIHQEESGTIQGAWKRFKVTLRPRHEGVTEIPAIELATYDPSIAAYRTVKTAPIKIEVQTSELLAPTDVITSEGTVRRRPGLERSESGIQANHVGAHVLEDQATNPSGLTAICAGMAALWVILAIFVGRHRRLHQDPAMLRKRDAARNAELALAGATDAESLFAAIAGYIADMRGVPAAGLTSADAARLMAEAGADEQPVREVQDYLESCEANRYGGAQTDSGGLAQEGKRIFIALRKVLSVFLLGCLIGITAAGSANAETEEQARMLVDADSAFHNANSPDAYLAAAARYALLLSGGFANGHIHYNMGNAYARAGHVGLAIASYEQALLYLPRNSDVVENLRVCRSRTVERLERAQPLSDRIFFWQPWLGLHENARLVLALATLALAAALLRLWRSGSMPRVVLGILLAAAVIAYLGYVGRIQTGKELRGIVTPQEIVLRKGPGESYAPAFLKPVHEGAPIRVREQRGEWLEVELPDGQGAWLQRGDVVLY